MVSQTSFLKASISVLIHDIVLTKEYKKISKKVKA